jgi:hypothetical protein
MDEHCVYKRISKSGIIFLVLYADNILLICIPLLQSLKIWLSKNIFMIDMGEITYILWIKIYNNRSRRLSGLYQSMYIDKILKWLIIEKSKRGYLSIFERNMSLQGYVL